MFSMSQKISLSETVQILLDYFLDCDFRDACLLVNLLVKYMILYTYVPLEDPPLSPSPLVTLITAGTELMCLPLTNQTVTLDISPTTKHDLLLLTTTSLLPLLISTLLYTSSMGIPLNPQSYLKMNLPLM